MPDATRTALAEIWHALGGGPEWPGQLTVKDEGGLPSAFAASDLAAASVGAACLAVAELVHARRGALPRAAVDRRLASFWFGSSIRPQGWALPPAWDAVAGDYRAADGWIKLHTNAPHHRAAALGVLGVPAERERVGQAVAAWTADALEAAIVGRGGCAAAMRGMAAWAAHPQGQAAAADPLLLIEPGEPGPAPGWTVPAGAPLGGVRVLDMTRVLAGPVATRFLAGFGADVLRIDPPGWDEPGLVPDVTLGKRCARLDLRQSEDRATWEGLLARADVLVHGYRPGALAGLGLEAARPVSRAGRCVAGCVRLVRPVAGAPRLRQPGADELRHRRGRHGPRGPRPPDALAGAGAGPCDGLHDGCRRGARADGPAVHGGGLRRAGVAGRHRRAADQLAAGRRRPARAGNARRPREGRRGHGVGTGAAGPAARRGRRRADALAPGRQALGIGGGFLDGVTALPFR